MANFSKLDENNVVIGGAFVDNENLLDENGVEQESIGIQYIHTHIPGSENYKWKQCSYNANFRNRFPGIGDIYIEDRDIFIKTPHFPSWREKATYDFDAGVWIPPIPEPEARFTDNAYLYYEWNEEIENWEEFVYSVPFPSWSSDPSSFNKDTKCWTPPVPYPVDGKFYQWNEDNQSWEESDEEPTYINHMCEIMNADMRRRGLL